MFLTETLSNIEEGEPALPQDAAWTEVGTERDPAHTARQNLKSAIDKNKTHRAQKQLRKLDKPRRTELTEYTAYCVTTLTERSLIYEGLDTVREALCTILDADTASPSTASPSTGDGEDGTFPPRDPESAEAHHSLDAHRQEVVPLR